MDALWDAFNDVAEGFGLSPDEFKAICVRAALADVLNISTEQLERRALSIFRAFDTDSVRPYGLPARCRAHPPPVRCRPHLRRARAPATPAERRMTSSTRSSSWRRLLWRRG